MSSLSCMLVFELFFLFRFRGLKDLKNSLVSRLWGVIVRLYGVVPFDFALTFSIIEKMDFSDSLFFVEFEIVG